MPRFLSVGYLVLLIILRLMFGWTEVSAQAILQNAFPNLSFSGPVVLCAPPDTSDRIFVVTQPGVIYDFPNRSTVSSANVFLDISDSVVSGGELGMLGLAFHPNYRNNGTFFVYYTVNNSVSGYPYASIVSRFQVSSTNPDSAIRNSEVVLMRINQPFPNHKGGQLAFGPDGDLYIGLGDGGSGGDPFGNGQNKTTWLGKILRINVDSVSGGLHYSIPADNPFANDTTSGVKKEIYAYGMRNPWRYSFDHNTGTLWVGDVGQDLWEEVDTIINGGNYGWNIMEGFHCYNPTSGCNTTGLQMPLLNYDHNNGQCAIIGGTVYRGRSIPALEGYYIYGDYCAGRVWSFDIRYPAQTTNSVLLNSGREISAFGVDKNQELYMCSYGDGQILKIVALPPGAPMPYLPANAQTNVSRNPTLVWSSVSNASGYHFLVSTDSLFGTVSINDSTSGDTTKQIGSLGYSTTYFWRVNASNSGGSSAYSSTSKFRTLDSTGPPPLPVLVSPPNGALNLPSIDRLRWQKISIATSYECQLSTDSLFANIIIDDTTLTDTFRQAGPLLNDTIYYWRVRGRNDAGYGGFTVTWFFRTAPYSIVVPLLRGWNLVSVPLAVENYAVHDLYTGAVSDAFAYIPDSGYSIRDSFQNGIGYWIRYPASQMISIAGTPMLHDSVTVAEGWNMIGSVSMPQAVTDVQSFPSGLVTSQFFGYGTSYFPTDSIGPGLGYWVKVTQPGTLFLNTAGATSGASLVKLNGSGPIRIIPISEFPPLPPTEADIHHPISSTPREFALEQNYPNPFNPTTIIKFTIPRGSFVTLKVFNLLGEEVTTLVEEELDPGVYQVHWDAGTAASGVYIYRLQVGLITETRKLLLLR